MTQDAQALPRQTAARRVLFVVLPRGDIVSRRIPSPHPAPVGDLPQSEKHSSECCDRQQQRHDAQRDVWCRGATLAIIRNVGGTPLLIEFSATATER